MPTERQHGGAALARIPLAVPGFRGLNKQQQYSILGPEWATALTNAVIDDSSRLAARRGWTAVTTSAVGAEFHQLFNYLKHDGTQALIASTDTALYASADGVAWTAVTNSIPFTVGNWQFQNFNNYVIGIQQGEALIFGTGGNFTQSAVTNVPSGNAILSAYQRLWAADSNGTTLRYCALLNHNDWSGTDAGSFDLTNVWPGTDTIQAIASFNGSLVVFGRNNIIFYKDDGSTALGMDPTKMVVTDVISGTGCIARDSVQNVDGDLWFLSINGLQSLGRLLVQQSNPLDNLSKNVLDYLLAATITSGFNLARLRAVYSPKDRLYLLSLPDEAGGGRALAFDTRAKLEDGSVRCTGDWSLVPSAMAVNLSETLYLTSIGLTGKVGRYSGGLDNGATYGFAYESGWMDLTEKGYLLIPKRYNGTFFSDSTVQANFRWSFDFSDTWYTRPKTFTAAGLAEYGVAEYGIAEYGGGIGLREGQVNPSGTGEILKLGVTATINDTLFAVQQLDFYCKIGRLT